MFGGSDFIDFMGYRNMVIEDKIHECLVAARNGQTEICINRGDLSDSEVEYLQKEVARRLRIDY